MRSLQTQLVRKILTSVFKCTNRSNVFAWVPIEADAECRSNWMYSICEVDPGLRQNECICGCLPAEYSFHCCHLGIRDLDKHSSSQSCGADFAQRLASICELNSNLPGQSLVFQLKALTGTQRIASQWTSASREGKLGATFTEIVSHDHMTPLIDHRFRLDFSNA